MNLKQIFDKHGADKSSKHKYHEIYEPLFEPNRNKKINFLEIGIWYGKGMEALLEYFPKGQIYGIDIFSRMTPADVPALRDPRANWATCDSTNPETISVLDQKFNVKFDYILDDGAHWPKANMQTFRNCYPFLKKGGLYIIEDVWPMERMNTNELGHSWLKRHPDRYNHLDNDEFIRELENSGGKIERFDNRQVSGQPDSYVITIRKN